MCLDITHVSIKLQHPSRIVQEDTSIQMEYVPILTKPPCTVTGISKIKKMNHLLAKHMKN